MNTKDVKILIAEDEELASEELREIIEKEFPEMEIAAITSSVKQTVEWLENHSCSLMMMDIYLSDGNAFEVFKNLQSTPPIIFTTAYDNFAVDAFKVNGIDYILKPYRASDIVASINKFKRISNGVSVQHMAAEKFQDTLKHDYVKRLAVKRGNQLVIYHEHEWAYFYAEGKFVCMVDGKGDTSVVGYTVDELERSLDPELFCRINRKYIVSVNAIKRLVLYDRYRIKIETEVAAKDDMIVSIDRAIKFKKWINKV